MMDRFRHLRDWLRAHPAWGLATCLLLLLASWGIYAGARYGWARSHHRQAEDAIAANQLEEARRQLDLCLEVWKKDADTHFLAARIARRLDDFDAAEHHLDISAKLGGDMKKIRLERTLLRAQRDTPVRDEGYLITLVQGNHADSVVILEALIKGYLKAYQLQRAHQCADLWLQRQPDSSQALYWRGMARERGLGHKEAMEDFQKAIAADPEYRQARLRLGELLLEQNLFEDAVGQYEWLYERELDNSEILLGLAQCRAGLSQLEQAQELFDRLLRDYPTSALVLSECGKMALRMNKFAEAEDLLRRSLEIDGYEPETVFAYSQALTQRGKLDDAKLWRDKHERIVADTKRLSELNREIVEHPDDPKPRHEIGVIFLRNGREAKGIGWLKTALEKDPRFQPAHLALAEYYERKGMKDEAAKHQ